MINVVSIYKLLGEAINNGVKKIVKLQLMLTS